VQGRSAFLDVRVLKKFLNSYEEAHNKEISGFSLGAAKHAVTQISNTVTQMLSSSPVHTNGDSIARITTLLDNDKTPETWISILLILGRYAMESQKKKLTPGDSKCFNCLHAMRTYILHSVLYTQLDNADEELRKQINNAIQKRLLSLAADEQNAQQALLDAYAEHPDTLTTRQEEYYKVVRDMVYLGDNEKAVKNGLPFLKILFGNLESPVRTIAAQNEKEVAISPNTNKDDSYNPSMPNPNLPNILHHRIYFMMYCLEKFPESQDRQTAWATFMGSIKSHNSSTSNLQHPEGKFDSDSSPDRTTPQSSPESSTARIPRHPQHLGQLLPPKTPHSSPQGPASTNLPSSPSELSLTGFQPEFATRGPSTSQSLDLSHIGSPSTPGSPDSSTSSPQGGGKSLFSRSNQPILGFMSSPPEELSVNLTAAVECTNPSPEPSKSVQP
jgi:hypothetical protein